MPSPKLTVLLETIRKLYRRGAHQALVRILTKTHSADVAMLLRLCEPRERKRFFALVTDLEQKVEIVSELDAPIAEELLTSLGQEEAVEILKEMTPDDAADLIAELPDSFSEQILAQMNQQDSEALETLMGFQENSAGGIMSPQYFALNKETTAGEAITALQKAEDVEMAFYVYVLNETNHLVGVLSLRQLVTVPANITLKELMIDDVISVHPDADQQEVAELVARYNFLALPVVDESNKMLGIITVDDVIDVIEEEATKDMLQMAGAGEELPEAESSLLENLRTRFPWLLMTCVGGIIASFVIAPFLGDHAQSRLAMVICMVPLVLGMARNIGNQTVMLVVRGLDTGQVVLEHIGRVFTRELLVGVAAGLFYGLIVGAAGTLQFSSLSFGIAVGAATMGSMILGVVIGSLTPIICARLNLDPTIARSPATMTSMDVATVVMFIGLARLFAGA